MSAQPGRRSAPRGGNSVALSVIGGGALRTSKNCVTAPMVSTAAHVAGWCSGMRHAKQKRAPQEHSAVTARVGASKGTDTCGGARRRWTFRWRSSRASGRHKFRPPRTTAGKGRK